MVNKTTRSDDGILDSERDRCGSSGHLVRSASEAMSSSTFYERKNVIVWRGKLHNGDRSRLTASEMSSNDLNKEWLDAAIANDSTYMSMEEMGANYKYQLDIGGVSGTSWGGLRWKMCTGNLVFKVNSWSKDWWYDMIEPYVHYIPVESNLSDLRQVYEWAESHPEEVDIIRKNGMEKCRETVTFKAINSFETNVFQQLQSSSKEIVDEVKLFGDGLLSFTI
jgi:Glycosyl transferase family 90